MAPGASALAKEEARVAAVLGGRSQVSMAPTAAKETEKHIRLCLYRQGKQRWVKGLSLSENMLKAFTTGVLCSEGCHLSTCHRSYGCVRSKQPLIIV